MFQAVRTRLESATRGTVKGLDVLQEIAVTIAALPGVIEAEAAPAGCR
jgi:hypothetical protein